MRRGGGTNARKTCSGSLLFFVGPVFHLFFCFFGFHLSGLPLYAKSQYFSSRLPHQNGAEDVSERVVSSGRDGIDSSTWSSPSSQYCCRCWSPFAAV